MSEYCTDNLIYILTSLSCEDPKDIEDDLFDVVVNDDDGRCEISITRLAGEAAKQLATLKEENERLRELLSQSAPIVLAHAEASHMLEGFNPRRNKWDALVEQIDAACENEWIPNNGQKPVLPGDTLVDVKFADGLTRSRSRVGYWTWRQDGADDDITYYRIHQPE